MRYATHLEIALLDCTIQHRNFLNNNLHLNSLNKYALTILKDPKCFDLNYNGKLLVVIYGWRKVCAGKKIIFTVFPQHF